MTLNDNLPVFPTTYDLKHNETFRTESGLTKLELISAMCLQGLLSAVRLTMDENSRVNYAISHAKILLKKLEAGSQKRSEE